MKTTCSNLVLSAACALAVFGGARAEASLPRVFGHNMVLQQGQKVPVWGKAAPSETVIVSFAGQDASVQADAKGRWRVDLAPLAASSESRTFSVATRSALPGAQPSTVTFTNVVVGEVWFCSGQSNMEYPMGGLPGNAKRRIKDSAREIAAANYPLLRHFKVPRNTATAPMTDVKGAAWQETTSASVSNKSAVAYVFGETLMKELKVPVGLIECSWGGTRIEPWTPAESDDECVRRQKASKGKKKQDVPTVLWNGMISGLVPYAIKGAIWYQGCANRRDGWEYLDKTVALVGGWRRAWGQGDFPYYLVQLAPFKYKDAKASVLPVIQEAQAHVPDKVPNSGYTVINDVGNVNDIHPKDKRTVGMRMADQVLDRVYGKFVRPWKTPVAVAWKVEGDAVRVSFENASGLKTRNGAEPNEFELCGADGVWQPAKARIEGSDVVLTAVSQPTKAVRFAYHNASTPNLVNGDGLPAGPFHFGPSKQP